MGAKVVDRQDTSAAEARTAGSVDDPPGASGESGPSLEVITGAAIGVAGGLLAGAVSGAPRTAGRALAGAVLGGLAGAGIGYVAEVRRKFRLGRDKFARIANVSPRTLAEWEKNPPADESRLRPIRELDRLFEALSQVVDPAEIGPWMERPNEEFEGLKPIEVLERGEADRIWRMIYFLESGSPS